MTLKVHSPVDPDARGLPRRREIVGAREPWSPSACARLRLAGALLALSAGMFALAVSSAALADGVRIGGSVTIKSKTGDINNRAVGEGAKAARCAGAIAGSDVEIEGDVDIEHTGSAQGCACVGDGCETADAAQTDPKTTQDGDSPR
jgi:hypothetical protein